MVSRRLPGSAASRPEAGRGRRVRRHPPPK